MALFSLPSTIRRGIWQLGFLLPAATGPALFGQTGVSSAADGFDPNVSGLVNAIAVQPNGQMIVGGLFSQLQPNSASTPTVRGNLARINLDGTLDPTFDPEPNGQVLAIVIDPNGNILIGGNFTSVGGYARNHIARLTSTGAVDPSFDPNATSNYAGSSQVYAIALQSNGSILIGGAFTKLQPNGAATTTSRKHIARLSSTGILDTTFDPEPNAMVSAIYVQPNGQILFGGGFTSLQPNGTLANGNPNPSAKSPVTRSYIARINADGSIDSFDPEANNLVSVIQMQKDGKILIGGLFSTLQPGATGTVVTADSIGRLNSDGSVDPTFTPQVATNVVAMALQTDGKIVIGGMFTTIQNQANSASANYAARLNPDGTADTTFIPDPNYEVNAIAVQADGKIVLGGAFSQVQPDGNSIGIIRNGIARINYDGTLDASFNPNTYGNISAVAIQATDGKIIIGGNFSSVAGVTRRNLARLNADGSLDTTFDPEPDQAVNCILMYPVDGNHADDLILIAGSFQNLGTSTTITRNNIARLSQTNGTVDTSFDPEANGVINSMVLQTPNLPNSKIIVGGGFAAFTPNSGSIVAPVLNSTTTTTATTINGNTSSSTTVTTVGTSTVTVVTTTTTNGTAPPITTTTTTTTVSTPASGSTPASTTKTTTTAVMTEAFYVARLNSDGTLDTSFLPSPNNNITAMLVEPQDNAVILAGEINSIAPLSTNVTTPINNIVRVSLTDGSVDTSFNPNPNSDIKTMALQADGKILLGGSFSELDANPVATSTTSTGTVTAITPPTTRNGLARLNPDGSLDTNFNPNVSMPGTIYTMDVNPTNGQIVVGGIFSSVGGTARTNVARINSDGSLDSGFSAAVNGVVDKVLFYPLNTTLKNSAGASLANAFLAVGAFTAVNPPGSTTATAVTHAVRFGGDGSLDRYFTPGIGASAQINAIAIQLDGKLLLGGNFANIGGSYATNFVRTYTDSAFDSTLAMNADAQVNAIAAQPDGSIYVGGAFNGIALTSTTSGTTTTTSGGVSKYFAHVDGSTSLILTTYPAVPNQPVKAIAVQPADSKVIIGGAFTSVGSTVVNCLARYNTDGSLDSSFNPAIGAGSVNSIIVQPADGKILIGGTFTTVAGVAHPYLARLNTDGSVDASFNPQFGNIVQSLSVSAVVLQPDGRILVGGTETTSNGAQAALMRFNSNGTTDSTFSVPAFSSSSSINTLVLEGDGTILAGGGFSTVNGTSVSNLAHFTAAGALDSTYNPNPNGPVTVMALQMDGKLYVAGSFSTIGGQARNGLARLMGPTTPILQTIAVSNDLQTITWSQSGPGPEPVAVIFQSSFDDATWTTIGPASPPVSGSTVWSYAFPGFSTLPGSTNFFIRAVTVVPTSENGSSGLNPAAYEFYQVPPPDLNSSTTVNTTSGADFYYQISGAYPATSYSASGLPTGLTLDSDTGIIWGTATTPGTYPITLTMTNSGGTTVIGPNGATVTSASGTTVLKNALPLTIIVSANKPSDLTAPVSRLIGLSSSAIVSSGNPLTVGLTITGTLPKTVFLEALGPTLSTFAHPLTPALDVPVLSVYDQYGRVIATNTVWYVDPSTNQNYSQSQILDIEAMANSVKATALTASNKDSAIVTTLAPGSYTIKITEASTGNGQGGWALAEIYDADPNPIGEAQRLFSISSNGTVSPGNSLSAGFAIQGNCPKTLLIRGIGPSLFNLGLPGCIPDPVLTIYDVNGSVVAQNTGWNSSVATNSNKYPANPAIGILAADSDAYAFALSDTIADSAVVVTLPAPIVPSKSDYGYASYTAEVTSASGASGPALIEIYEVPNQTGD